MSDQLCHDFKSPRADASRRLPYTFRFIPIAVYAAFVLGAYFVTMDVISLRRAEKEKVAAKQMETEYLETRKKYIIEKENIDIEKAKAEIVAKWVEGTRVVQPICVETARAVKGEVSIAEFAIMRSKELPAQLNVVLRLNGAEPLHLNAIESAFGKLNYRPYSPQQARTQDMIDYRSTLVFQNE